jgi:hypothetical protein
MNKNSNRISWLVYLQPLILAWVMPLSSCSSTSTGTASIYGKWRLVHSNQSEAAGTPETKEKFELEFKPDGALIEVEGQKTYVYRYRYSGGNSLQLILADGPLDKKIEFQSASRMRLIQDRQGVAFLTPIVDEYERLP